MWRWGVTISCGGPDPGYRRNRSLPTPGFIGAGYRRDIARYRGYTISGISAGYPAPVNPGAEQPVNPVALGATAPYRS
jgi:hypothetical protein